MSLLPVGIRRASHRLARSPGFTVAAVAMLALGLGATRSLLEVLGIPLVEGTFVLRGEGL